MSASNAHRNDDQRAVRAGRDGGRKTATTEGAWGIDMASIGPLFPGTATSRGVPAWSNPDNVKADDSNYATCTGIADSDSGNLDTTNYDFSSLPDGATVTSIVATMKRKDSFTADATDSNIQLIIGGSPSGTNASTGSSWPSTEETKTWTFSTSLPTVAQIKASDFGWTARAAVTVITTLSVNTMQLTVNYDAAPLTATITDRVGLRDSVLRTETAFRLLTDNLGIGDSLLRRTTCLRLVSNLLGVRDSLINRGAIRNVAVSDLLALRDTVQRKQQAFRRIVDRVALADALVIPLVFCYDARQRRLERRLDESNANAERRTEASCQRYRRPEQQVQ